MSFAGESIKPMSRTQSRTLGTFSDGLRIVTFDSACRAEFKRLNVAWLTKFFKVEPIDERTLSDPEGQILQGGGEVLFALLDAEVVGTVALKVEDAHSFELTKMAVDERYQGRGVGKRLLQSACDLARERGASCLILYSQRSLQPAVAMYFSHGFVAEPVNDARYSRCDIKMRLDLRLPA